MPPIQALDFTVKKDDLHTSQFVEKTYADELASGQVLLEIEKISFTSNNITYGVVGAQMNYWAFFPTQEGYGIIPAWGFGRVIHSNHPDVQVGQRFYGYYPMGTHLLVSLDKVSSRGFMDKSEHRLALPPVYNFYANTETDQSFSPDTEALVSIFRPLFVTSFLIDAFLADQNFYGATQILLTSASSKTAQALAFLLAQRKKEEGLNIKLIGLTSSKNVDFIESLGWYDQAIRYEDISQLDTQKKSIIVDFAGNHSLQFSLQTLLADKLVYNCLVGLVDWQNRRGEKPLPKRGELFFAPTHAGKRQKEWGPELLQQKIASAWLAFIGAIQSSISIKAYAGRESLQQLYGDMLNGRIDPSCGNMVSLNE